MAHIQSVVVYDTVQRTRAALKFAFEREGWGVWAADDANDTMSMASTRGSQLVVVSVAPGDEREQEAGFRLIGRLRESGPTAELPLVALGEPGAREQALRAGADEFIARPAFIRDVLTLCKLAVAVRQDGDEAGVAAALDDYQLFFLTRALATAGRSGVLELERGARSGEVHFAKGQVVGARVGDGAVKAKIVGVPAFHHLLLWTHVSMHLRYESPSLGEKRLTVRTEELLEDGAKFAREFEAMADKVGGAQAVYRQEPRKAADARSKIPAEVMALLKVYDGRRPLIDVVEDSPFKPFDTIKITHRLAEMGVIERVSASLDTAPLTAALAVRDWLLGGRDDTPSGGVISESYKGGDTDRVATQAVPATVEDAPTAPREGARGPEAKNKKRKRSGKTGPTPKIAAPPPPPPIGDDTVPFMKPSFDELADRTMVMEKLDEAMLELAKSDAKKPEPKVEPPKPAAPKVEAKPATVAKPVAKPAPKAEPPRVAPKVEPPKPTPAPVAAPPKVEPKVEPPPKPVPAPVAAPPKAEPPKPVPAPAAAPRPPKVEPPKPAPAVVLPAPVEHEGPAAAPPRAKPAAAKPAAAGNGHLKEVAFSDIEEDFFARESEIAKVEVDNFDDLEPVGDTSPKRRWFGLGGKFNTQSPRDKKAPKKR
jgi:CheY-like chemotaxis protein